MRINDLTHEERDNVEARLAKQPLCKHGHRRADNLYLSRKARGDINIGCGDCSVVWDETRRTRKVKYGDEAFYERAEGVKPRTQNPYQGDSWHKS